MPILQTAEQLPTSTDVLIVGAGPTGMALACALQTLGVDHVVIETAAQRATHSRAAAAHARTLESLSTIGAAQTLISLGRPGRAFTARDGDELLLATPFNDLDSPFPFVLGVPQETTERVLEERIGELGGRVWRSHTLVDLKPRREGRSAIVTHDATGEVRAVEARFVVGCDGLHSSVRELSGISSQAHDRPHNFALIEFTMDWNGPEGEISFYFSPAGLLVVSHLAGDLFRVVALIGEDDPVPDLPAVQRMMDERGPAAAGASVKSLAMVSTWKVRHRLADSFRCGPVFLVGDAAHAHSPIGAQGMNTGIQDSFNLAWKLAAVIDGTASADLLDTYDDERRPIAQGVLAFTSQMHDLATMQDLDGISLRNALLGTVGKMPQFSTWLAQRLAQVAVTYSTTTEGPKPRPGDRMPPRPAMAHGLEWSLLLPPDADVGAAKEAASLSPTAITVGTADDLSHAVLVRPDGFVGLSAPGQEAAELPARLAEWLGGTPYGSNDTPKQRISPS